MSGASAVASARRRRADPTPSIIKPEAKSDTIKQEKNNEINEKQVLTPLQILQMHDKKIKDLETNLETNLESIIVEISKKVLSENIKYFNLDKEEEVKKEIVEFDSAPILKEIDTLSNKFDELKTLLIKSQQTTNESSNEMLKIKDKILGLEEHVNKIETQIKENEEIHENIFNMNGNNSAEMLLRSMMESSTIETSDNEKINIHDDDIDNDSTEIGELSEIILSENDLNKLKTEVVTEVNKTTQEIKKSSNLIEVSDTEDEENK